MPKYPALPNIILQLRHHMTKSGYNTAQVVVMLNAFGSNWNATRVDDLLAGRAKPTNFEIAFLKRYLLDRFYDYNRG